MRLQGLSSFTVLLKTSTFYYKSLLEIFSLFIFFCFTFWNSYIHTFNHLVKNCESHIFRIFFCRSLLAHNSISILSHTYSTKQPKYYLTNYFLLPRFFSVSFCILNYCHYLSNKDCKPTAPVSADMQRPHEPGYPNSEKKGTLW